MIKLEMDISEASYLKSSIEYTILNSPEQPYFGRYGISCIREIKFKLEKMLDNEKKEQRILDGNDGVL